MKQKTPTQLDNSPAAQANPLSARGATGRPVLQHPEGSNNKEGEREREEGGKEREGGRERERERERERRKKEKKSQK